MFATDDTIVAIATPPGRGGIGVVRLSGPGAPAIARALLDRRAPLRPRAATFARVAGDQVVATYFPCPRSYTGDEVVEISAHGSPVVLAGIVRSAVQQGARLAEPGEFTLRAFLNGRIDLIQAEAVADLIEAVTPLQARAAFDQLEGTLTERIGALHAELFDLVARLEASLDFPDEGYHFVGAGELGAELGRLSSALEALLCDAGRGRLLREGARVVIAGRPNVGKSSLFNALVGAGRAIVTAVPGTTRDLLTESVDMDGLALELVDTAGIREVADEVEVEGVSRARRAWDTADLLLVLLDRSVPLGPADLDILRSTERRAPRMLVLTKSDLPARWTASEQLGGDRVFEVSARTGHGLDELRAGICDRLLGSARGDLRDTVALTNARHAGLLERAHGALHAARAAAIDPAGAAPEEFVLMDLEQARSALEEITGKRTSEDLLRHIFSRFCVGK